MAETVAVYRAQGEAFRLVESLRRLGRYREVLLTFALRDLKVRYKQTLLGVLWAAIPPFTLMVIFTVIFSRFARMPSEGVPYPVFVYSALLPWSYFASSVTAASNSLIGNYGIVSKIAFPREILPWSAIAATAVDFLVAACIFVGLVIIYDTPVSWHVVFVLPLLAIQILFAAGVGLIMAALNVYYRDVRYALPLVMQLWLYATPVAYPVSLLPDRLHAVYFLANPMAALIDGYRRVLVRELPPDPVATALGIVSAVAVFLISYRIFKKLERAFVDVM